MEKSRGKTHEISDSEESDGSADLFDDRKKTNPKQGLMSKGKSERPREGDKFEKEKVSGTQAEDEYDADTDVDESSNVEISEDRKPLCKYGSKCFRKNPSHLQEFHHPKKRKSDCLETSNSIPHKKTCTRDAQTYGEKTLQDVFEEVQPFSLFLTKVHGISQQYNNVAAFSLKDLLSPEWGELKSSCHFNFMFDIPWLMGQYPRQFRNLPVLLVHGDQGRAELDLKEAASHFPNISLCRARLDIPYGTHHTKMMLLLYTKGLRVIVHTSNLISNDWYQKTQGMWVSQIFPLKTNDAEPGESRTKFKASLLQYLAAYGTAKLAMWEKVIKEHDMSSANVHIIASVPGRHVLEHKHSWGHLRVKKILSSTGPDQGIVKNWPVIGQFSSIGSLGANPEAWLLTEWGQSMSTYRKTLSTNLPASKLHLIFPSKDNIQLSLEGYNGGGCVPYSIKTASKQPWLIPFLSQWKSEGRGRSPAVPHIKTYSRMSPDGSEVAWFLLTSANLSKAAWGAFEKKGSQLMIRSYELGIMFMPSDFGSKTSFKASSQLNKITDSENCVFPLPYDLPPATYVKGDRPWFCDVPCMDAPDTFGKMWCPPL